MKKWKRELRKKIRSSVEPYDVWAGKHAEELGRIAARREEDVEAGPSQRARRRLPVRIWLPAAGLLALVALTAAALVWNAQSGPSVGDLASAGDSVASEEETFGNGGDAFGDDTVTESAMSEGEIAALVDLIPQFSRFTISDGSRAYHEGNGAKVMDTIRGEYETADDFYLIEARILYDDNFFFLNRYDYADLEQSRSFGDVTVTYEFMKKDQDDIYLYYALSESAAGRVYWRVESLEGRFDEWLEDTFA